MAEHIHSDHIKKIVGEIKAVQKRVRELSEENFGTKHDIISKEFPDFVEERPMMFNTIINDKEDDLISLATTIFHNDLVQSGKLRMDDVTEGLSAKYITPKLDN